jgi:hypothetical protein
VRLGDLADEREADAPRLAGKAGPAFVPGAPEDVRLG